MRIFFISLGIVFFLSFINQQIAAASKNHPETRDEITWYRADFPPVTIPQGEHADSGFFDKTMFFLIDHLMGYTHQFKTANFKRIILELTKKNNVCCPSLYKTPERERFTAFSVPAMVVLPNGIITSESHLKKLSSHIDSEGRVSLRSLLKDDTVTVGISSGRKYSGNIDQIIADFIHQKTVFIHSGQNVFRGLLSMMYKGRIDCLIGYPAEAEYYARQKDVYRDYKYLPIKESSVPFTVGYIGCTNNQWGQKVIQQINDTVRENRLDTFINFYGDWLEDSTKEYHRNLALDSFKEISQ